MLNPIETLCCAKSHDLAHWLMSNKNSFWICLSLVFIGGSLYGLSLGIWRSPLQAFYVAVKFPLLLCLTMFANGLINGMLAQILGVNISFRECLLTVIASFALLAVILGSFFPLSLFFVYNLPPMGSAQDATAHSIFLLSNVALIALAGTLANVHLYGLLLSICGVRTKALQVLVSWLMTNMFLGCQLSWNLRPFFGSPNLPVRFIRENPFDSSFYEAIWHMLF